MTPPTWHVPREWPDSRCFIICGGESIRDQRKLIPKLKGRFIAIKEGVLVRPDADVLFLGGEKTADPWLPLIPKFSGKYIVVRGKFSEGLPDTVKLVTRPKDHTRLCELADHVCGFDSGTSAINLAYHFGATEIVLLGYDMQGGRWFTDAEYMAMTGRQKPHPAMHIPEQHHSRHRSPLPELAEDAKAKGIRIVNCSPISRVTAFETQPLEAFL